MQNREIQEFPKEISGENREIFQREISRHFNFLKSSLFSQKNGLKFTEEKGSFLPIVIKLVLSNGRDVFPNLRWNTDIETPGGFMSQSPGAATTLITV